METTEVKQKHCWSCDSWFPATAEYFHRDSSTSSGLHGSCKTCKCNAKSIWQKENRNRALIYVQDFLKRNPEYWKKYSRPSIPRINRRAENRKYIWSIKEQGCCVMCGEVRPEVLLFHHKEPREKVFTISNPKARPLSEIKTEIAKCDLMCANCHVSLHYWERHK